METAVAQRQFEVKVFFAHMKGDKKVDAAESSITFARCYTINDVYVSEDWAELVFDPFGRMFLNPPNENRHPELIEHYREFLASLEPHDYLEGTTADQIIIPVSRFEFIEGNWFDQ